MNEYLDNIIQGAKATHANLSTLNQPGQNVFQSFSQGEVSNPAVPIVGQASPSYNNLGIIQQGQPVITYPGGGQASPLRYVDPNAPTAFTSNGAPYSPLPPKDLSPAPEGTLANEIATMYGGQGGVSPAPVQPGVLPDERMAGDAGLYSMTEQERRDQEYRQSVEQYYQGLFNKPIDPNQIYNNNLQQFQAQIDAINAMYADRLNQARIEGQGRIETRQFAQGRAGQIGSGTGEAGIQSVQDANTRVYNSIENERMATIEGIFSDVRRSSREDLHLATEAQRMAADKASELIEGRTQRTKNNLGAIIGELYAKGVYFEDMTPDQFKSFADGIGVTEREFEGVYKAFQDMAIAEDASAALQGRKTLSEIENKDASTAKILRETEEIGKMTPYQQAMVSISRERLAQSPQAQKDLIGSYVGQMQALIDTAAQGGDGSIVPVGFLTPSEYKDAKQQFIMASNDPEAGTYFDAAFAQYMYVKEVDKKSKYTQASYGIIPIKPPTIEK